MSTIRVSKLSIALVQLETAIKLFLSDNNYICAATLAGAAEEILGEYAKRAENSNAYSELSSELKDDLNSLIPGLNVTTDFIGKNYLNFHRNELKHFHKPENEELEFDDQMEAACLILRAIINLITHDKSLTHNTVEFLEWLYKNKPNLLKNDYQHPNTKQLV